MTPQRLIALSLTGLLSCAETAPQNKVGWKAPQYAAEQRCQHGSSVDCGQLGSDLVNKSADGKDFERGLVLLETACGQGDLPACTTLGTTYAYRSEGASAVARAHELLTDACQRRSAVACTGLGQLARMQEPDDDTEAIAALHQGCQLGDARGCELFALAKWKQSAGGDKALAEEAFTRACGAGLRSSCQLLAMVYLRDPERQRRGADLLADNCQKQHIVSCTTLAALFAPLISRQPQCVLSLPWAQRACDGKDTDGCAIIAACGLTDQGERASALDRLRSGCDRKVPLACLYWADAQADDVSPSPRPHTERDAAYATACRGGEFAPVVACPRLAAANLATAKSPPEAEAPLAYLQKDCADSSREACCALAAEYHTGKWVTADRVKAAELRKKACQLGAERCCRTVAAPAKK